MDHEAFDRITRLFGVTGTRRTALAALLSAGLLGVTGKADAKTKRRQKERLSAQAQPRPQRCSDPGPGQNLSKCDFTRADLRGRSLRGANLSRAKLVGAELCGVDLRGANLDKTDFTGAHLTRVDFRGTNLSRAILTDAHFCQTTRPNGKLDHTHCPPEGDDVCCGDDECDGVCQRGLCLERSCHFLGQLCEAFAPADTCGHCCDSAPPTCDREQVFCAPEADFVTFRCRKFCDSNADCARFGSDFECRHDPLQCPFADKCCLAKECTRNSDCANNKCCLFSSRNGVCCRSDQRCGFPAFELPCVDL
jgi:hypothetical protein